MMELWNKIKNTFLTKQFILFVMIGVFNTFNGTAVSYVLSIFLQANIAFVVGYIISLFIAYVLNSIFNFKQKMSVIGYAKFFVSYIPNFIIQNITVIIVYNVLHWHKLVAYALAAIIGIPVTFLFLKCFAFSQKNPTPNVVAKSKVTLTEWINKHIVLVSVTMAILFVVYAFVTNWSLVLGENLMKWDIWDAEYPNEVLLSDALKNHTFPVWNPLMHYGVPNYASFGTPIWYPITIFLAFIGYTPSVLGISYVLHLAIGGYGMYWLVKQEIQKQKKRISISELLTSATAGILYCSSGLFLSNAQHIMIIISAAWIPYVFYFTRKAISEKKFVYTMCAGLCAGFLWTAGYPELFYNMFLFLIPYTLYFNYDKEYTIFRNIWNSAIRYIKICICTVCSCAISLIPVLINIGNTTRTNGLGMEVQDYKLATLLSLVLPQNAYIVDNVESSMVNYYMGIIVILLLPMVLTRAYRNRIIYASLAAIALLLCLGSLSPVHGLLYRFAPMYTMFRFATTSRVFVAMFSILFISRALKDVFNGDVSIQSIKFSRIVAGVMLIVAIIISIAIPVFSESINESIVNKYNVLNDSIWIATLFVSLYTALFYFINKDNGGQRKILKMTFLMLICIETSTYIYLETPITIARYEPTMYQHDLETQNSVETAKKENKSRNTKVNFAKQARSDSKLNSQNIVFGKTFDESGYLSFIYDNIENYKLSYHNSITKQNPEVFFTNNIVSEKNTDFSSWSNDGGVAPEQIYVEKSSCKSSSNLVKFKEQILKEKQLSVTSLGDEVVITSEKGKMSSGKRETGRIRVILNESVDKSKMLLQCTFVDVDGNGNSYNGEYEVQEKDAVKYIDIYYPTSELKYKTVTVSLDESQIKDVKQVVVKPMISDGIVNVKSFGFNGLDMEVNNEQDGYAVLLQMYHYGWKAYVDGKKVDIDTINNCFMGVHIKPGTHKITFKFRPLDLYVGASVTILYYIILVVMMGYNIIGKRRKSMDSI